MPFTVQHEDRLGLAHWDPWMAHFLSRTRGQIPLDTKYGSRTSYKRFNDLAYFRERKANRFPK